MKKRRLGANGPEISAIGLGCMGMSEFYGVQDRTEALATIHRSLDQGCNFLDTADMYGMGRNEELVGEAVRERRGEVYLATKFAIMRSPEGVPIGINGKPEYVREACEKSLRRLGVDVIDLYYQHRVDPETPIEETVGAMAELVREGKVRHLGLSEARAETIRRAHATHPITALQSEYSLWTRDHETNGVIDTCRELGIGFVPYSPLGRGFLTGAIKSESDFDEGDTRRMSPRFQGENFQKNLDLVERVKSLAEKKGCTPSQLALAWVLAQGEDMIPIPGTKRRKYLDDNLGSLEVTLTAAELDEISSTFPPDAAAGLRYPEFMMQFVNG